MTGTNVGHTSRLLAALTGVLLLVACSSNQKPTPENLLNTLNAYLPDHRDCLLDGSIRFPYETSDPAQIKKMDALVKAEVLIVSREPAIKISRYALTPTGQAATPNLCFGYRQATAIVNSTPPSPGPGYTQTHVTYKYELMDLPMWARTPDVRAQFPVLAKEATGSATDTITLALTGVGWTVPN